MADLTRTRSRELEAGPGLNYDFAYNCRAAFVELGMNGKIVIKDTDREWELARQGHLKFYMLDQMRFPENALQNWQVFIHDLKTVSGKHRHQGGLVLFIIEGHGASEVNGEVIEWHKGDCVMLPMHPVGLEHKHWNMGTDPAKWLAFIYVPAFDHAASELKQIDVCPEFLQRMGGG